MNATPPPLAPPPGWYPDPAGGPTRRYWDGNAWGPTESLPGSPQSQHVAATAPHGSYPYQQQAWTAGQPWQRGVYQVRITEHTGMLIAWLHQKRTVTGTYSECAAALKAAQGHNLILGWWSVFSALFFNWIALGANRNARKTLEAAAARDGWLGGGNQSPVGWTTPGLPGAQP